MPTQTNSGVRSSTQCCASLKWCNYILYIYKNLDLFLMILLCFLCVDLTTFTIIYLEFLFLMLIIFILYAAFDIVYLQLCASS